MLMRAVSPIGTIHFAPNLPRSLEVVGLFIRNGTIYRESGYEGSVSQRSGFHLPGCL